MATEDEAKSVAFVIMLENEVLMHLLLCSWFSQYMSSMIRIVWKDVRRVMECVTSMMSFHLDVLKHL